MIFCLDQGKSKRNTAAGLKDQELFAERENEVKAGTLQMPTQPAPLYVYSSRQNDFDAAAGKVKNGYLRYVIYILMPRLQVPACRKNHPLPACRGSCTPEHMARIV